MNHTRPYLEACRRVILERYRAGETREDIAADYAIYGFTTTDIHAITTQGATSDHLHTHRRAD